MHHPLGVSSKVQKEGKVIRYISRVLLMNFAAYDVGGTVITGNEVVNCSPVAIRGIGEVWSRCDGGKRYSICICPFQDFIQQKTSLHRRHLAFGVPACPQASRHSNVGIKISCNNAGAIFETFNHLVL